MDINLNTILFYLGPQTGNIIWTIFLYIIFGLSVITLLTMPDKNFVPTLLMSGVILVAAVAKVSIAAQANPSETPIFTKLSFGMYVINVVPVVFPALAAGMIRARKKSRAVIPAVLTAIFGAVYFFLFWFIEQRTA